MSYDQTETYVLNFENVTHEDAAKHIAVYFLWALFKNLLSTDFFSEDDLHDIRKKKINIIDALEKYSDYHLLEDMFNELGNEFTEYYYDEFYIQDYTNTFNIKSDSEFFDIELEYKDLIKIFDVLDFRFNEWNSKKPPIKKVTPEDISPAPKKPKNVFSDFTDEETALVTTNFFSEIKKSNTLIAIGCIAGIIGILCSGLTHKFPINEYLLIPTLIKVFCGLYGVHISSKTNSTGSLTLLLAYLIIFMSNFFINYSSILYPLYVITLLFFYKLNKKMYLFLQGQLA